MLRVMMLVVGALAALSALGAAAASAADPPRIVIGADGKTAPVFGYTDAVRERVWVDSDFDSDLDGVKDLIAVDIMRPAATEQGLKVPVIIDDSPYYSTLGRGNESEFKVDDANGLLARWPLFHDNYFVPRSYAVVLVDMTGTNHSTGCPTIQGDEDNNAGPEVIDCLGSGSARTPAAPGRARAAPPCARARGRDALPEVDLADVARVSRVRIAVRRTSSSVPHVGL